MAQEPISPTTQETSAEAVGRRLAQARRLKGVREWRDVTHAEIAKEARTSPQSVSRWEAGKAMPQAASLALAASYLGADENWLRANIGEPPSPFDPADGTITMGPPKRTGIRGSATPDENEEPAGAPREARPARRRRRA